MPDRGTKKQGGSINKKIADIYCLITNDNKNYEHWESVLNKLNISGPEKTYRSNIDTHNTDLDQTKKKSKKIGYLRLSIVLLGGTIIYLLFKTDIPSIYYILLTVFIFGVFFKLVRYHDTIKQHIELLKNLIVVNELSVDRLQNKWFKFSSNGNEFSDKNHPFCNDLDIVGHASVFQWINASNTFYGRKKLKKLLMHPEKGREDIQKRQKAIIELSNKLDYRQLLQASGLNKKGLLLNPEELLIWCEDRSQIITNTLFKILIRCLPVITVLLFIAPLYFSFISYTMLLPLIMLNLIIIIVKSRDIKPIFNLTEKYNNFIQNYQDQFTIIENEPYEDLLLSQCSNILKSKTGSASDQIYILQNIVNKMNLRYSNIHFIFNVIFLWDLQCCLSLDKWRSSSGLKMRNWIESTGLMEALSSLSIISYDNPAWTIPEIKTDRYVLNSKDIGHPLISKEKRICNDFSMEGANSIALITGSNMSGKSTMLRTIGVNLVLAYTGAPVCAGYFACSVMDIFTSMRINDNLEENVSSFYAELLRMKMIIDASKTESATFFLLDEVFHGTNTNDRRRGAEIIMRNLTENGSMGLVSTHDIELTVLEKDKDLKILNYFFKEEYENNKIHFDYKIRKGISNTTNAIELMKIIGIDVGT